MCQHDAPRLAGGPARGDDEGVAVGDWFAAFEQGGVARCIHHDRGAESLDEARHCRLAKAHVKRQEGIAVVPAAPEHLDELRAAGHREGHEAAHVTSVRGWRGDPH